MTQSQYLAHIVLFTYLSCWTQACKFKSLIGLVIEESRKIK